MEGYSIDLNYGWVYS